MVWSLRPAFNLAISVVILLQLSIAGTIPHVQSTRASAAPPATAGTIIQRQTVPAGGRTVLTVRTSGVVEVVIFEHIGEAGPLRTFQAGGIPRTAKVFTNIRDLAYPLASETGGDFYVRVRPLAAGMTTLQFEPGTIAQAMARLRGGKALIRNRGTVLVHGSLHQMAVYQLVPGTIIRLEIMSGRGTVALLKTRDYLAVRNGRSTLASRCIKGSCLRSESSGEVLEFRLDDYDDRYLAAVSDGAQFIFSYQVIATPMTLNYITTCL